MSNNLLLTIDDAVSVAMRCINDEIDLDKETFNYIEWLLRSEFEQKCYILNKDMALSAIISGISPQTIGGIISGEESLADWCKTIQIKLQRYMMGD